jgi:hypothetical protein
VSDQRATTDPGAARLQATQDALHKVQAQAAALEELSEHLSLSLHVLETEVSALAEHLRAGASELPEAPGAPSTRSDDVEGARLVALNMALNGDSREAADRYVGEHFDVPDRERLLDEVYAAIER